jgi:allantoin racemase
LDYVTMRICLLNPNSTVSMTEEMVEAAREAAGPNTVIEGETAVDAPPTIEGYRDEALAAAAVAEIVARRRDDFDAFVIACFGDPGLYAAREIVDCAVVGIAEASFMLATALGHRFAILTNNVADIPEMDDLVRRYGFGERYSGTRAVSLSVADADSDREAAFQAYAEEGRKAIEADGAAVLCLGCGPMLGLRERLETSLRVPVIEGVPAAIVIAESLLRLRFTTSKARAFYSPEGLSVP